MNSQIKSQRSGNKVKQTTWSWGCRGEVVSQSETVKVGKGCLWIHQQQGIMFVRLLM